MAYSLGIDGSTQSMSAIVIDLDDNQLFVNVPSILENSPNIIHPMDFSMEIHK